GLPGGKRQGTAKEPVIRPEDISRRDGLKAIGVLALSQQPGTPPTRPRTSADGQHPSQQGRAQQQASTQPTGPTSADRAEAPATEAGGPSSQRGFRGSPRG